MTPPLVPALLVAVTTWMSGGDGSGAPPTSAAHDTLLAPSGCPVADESFCAVAVDVAQALGAGDVEALLALSRVDSVECDDVVQEYFPDCQAGGSLHGYGMSGPDFVVRFVDEEAYVEHLLDITDVDPGFHDEVGDGAVGIVGVGTCGPDVPGRRTYHLAWAAAHREPGGLAERVLGSFELTFDDVWRIALTYVGTLTQWQAEHVDPLRDAFCEAGRSPWPT